MVNVEIRDGDVVILAGYTCGRVLEVVQESGAAVTVVVVGPTFDREYAGTSIVEFARTTPSAEVRLLSPQHETPALLADGTATFVPLRSPDQPAIVRRIIERAERVIGACETSVPRDGTLTPGACGLCVPTVLEQADVTIAEVNPKAPRFPGLSFRAERFDHCLDAECELPRIAPPERDATTEAIGENVATLVPDGATIELGIGSIPAAVARLLASHSNLGLHGGFVSPVVRTLVEDGIVTRGSHVAEKDPDCPLGHPILANTVVGHDRSFYDWLAESGIATLDTMYRTCDPEMVASNPKFTAINGAVQVDIHGQVNAERLKTRQISTAGGQLAYLRAARKSTGGAGIVALTSEAQGGLSKIVPTIPDSGIVTTPRTDIDYIVSEHGTASLFGETLTHRTQQLISTAAPRYRESLRETAQDQGLL